MQYMHNKHIIYNLDSVLKLAKGTKKTSNVAPIVANYSKQLAVNELDNANRHAQRSLIL